MTLTDKRLEDLSDDALLSEAEQARDRGDLAAAEAGFAVGMSRFPSRLDRYGHPTFQKELVRMLVNRQLFDKAMSHAPRQGGAGGDQWHCILFARAYAAAQDARNAEFWWNKALENEPSQTEAKNWLFKHRHAALLNHPQPFADIIGRCRKADFHVIFDVGANDGESCVKYSQLFPDAEILTFEPAPETFAKLANNVSGIATIRPVNIALGDVDGVVSMRMSGTSTMNRVVAAGSAGGTPVPSCRLDTFCKGASIPHIDFLKIDTEGHDLSVLRGCGEFIENIDLIQCEASANDYNQFHTSYIDIFHYMTSKSFYLFNIYGQTFEWGNGGYPVCRRFDPVFVNKKLVGDMKNVITH